MISLKELLGILLVLTGILDAIKYTVQANKIRRDKIARMSRKFINWALLNDYVRLIYGIVIYDWFIMTSALLALICMTDLWITIYRFYPYRKRGLLNFKRPPVIKYLWNSLQPNYWRKRL